jgi:hypothetical protein
MSPPFKKRLNFALLSSFLVLIRLSTNFFSFASSGFDGSVVNAQSPISVCANPTLTSATSGNAKVHYYKIIAINAKGKGLCLGGIR